MSFTKYLLSNLIFLLSCFPDVFQIDNASFLPDGFNILQPIHSLNICLKSKGGLRAVSTLGQFSPAICLTKVRFCVLVELLGLRHILRQNCLNGKFAKYWGQMGCCDFCLDTPSFSFYGKFLLRGTCHYQPPWILAAAYKEELGGQACGERAK